MHIVSYCLAALALATPSAAPQSLAFVESSASRPSFYVGEPVRVRIAFGLRRELLEDGLVQLFLRPLDVPVQLSVPWLGGLPGVTALPAEPAGGGVTIALDGEVVRVHPGGERVQDGVRHAVFELERVFVPQRAGELVFPAPELRFAHATRFEDDFLDGRAPADRRELTVHGQPLVLAILPLPEEGRLPGFAGAVGRFRVSASVQPHDVEVGQSMELVLTLGGAGQRGEPPRLDLPGFHVRGVVRRGDAFVYDVAPRSTGVSAVPSISLAFFDPGPPAGYVSVATEPLPIRVRAGAAQPPESSPPALAPASRWEELAPWAVALAIVALLVALVVRGRRRRTG